jgi:hypothetical protein
MLIGLLFSLTRSAALTRDDVGDNPAPTATNAAVFRTLRLSIASSLSPHPADVRISMKRIESKPFLT